jgi:hypothetical protein
MSGARPAAQGGCYHHIFQEVATMINFRIGRVASAAAILTVLASSAAFPAAARPLDPITRHRTATSRSQTHRWTVRYAGSTVN